MTGNDQDVLVRSNITGQYRTFCRGPDPDGSCPRTAIGDVIPCAGHAIRRGPAGPIYTVARTATLCPVTLAQSLAVTSDSTLTG